MDYELNREQLSVMPLVSPFADILAWVLPLIEFAIAVIIFMPKSRTIGLLLGTGLMLSFKAYVALLMAQPGALPCTCGGFLKSISWPQHPVFNLVFVALGSIAVRSEEHKSENHSLIRKS